MSSSLRFLLALLLSASCTPVKRQGGDEVFDAQPGGDGAPPDAFADACPTDPCVENRFPSTGEDGAFAPGSDTVLPPGIYHFTTITIPSGVTVTTDSNARLDLRATGAVVIDGVIDLSGSDGGLGGLGPGTGCREGGGGGGTTGNPLAAADDGTVLCGVPGFGGAAADGADGGEQAGSTCFDQGGKSGGGAGASTCIGAGGGGGFAGGGGGAGYDPGFGGVGGSYGGAIGGAGGTGHNPGTGAVATGGGGGQAPGMYRGLDGQALDDCSGTNTFPGSNGGGGSIGAIAANDLAVATTFYVGSGGGGGGGQCNECNSAGGTGSGGGGGGGGALRVASATRIAVGATGALRANGGQGGDGGAYVGSAGGGGGSGGVIDISAPRLEVAAGAVVSAIGGGGGAATDGVSNCGVGGRGGLGRIRLSARNEWCTLEGTFDPPLVDGCEVNDTAASVFIAEYPD